jgi:hypothetical protein
MFVFSRYISVIVYLIDFPFFLDYIFCMTSGHHHNNLQNKMFAGFGLAVMVLFAFYFTYTANQAGNKISAFMSRASERGDDTVVSKPQAVQQSSCQVWGRVIVAPAGLAECPTDKSSYPGSTLPLKVSLYQNQNVVTSTILDDMKGNFHFDSVAPGVYDVCTELPANYSHLCNLPREDGHNPFNTQCARIDTSSSCGDISLVLSTITH